MAQLHQSMASLRIFGDDLIPGEITELLGCQPTDSYAKGQIVRGEKTGREYVKQTGMWQLEATDHQPGDLDQQIAELLGKVTDDLRIWVSLSEQFSIDIFCGLFMEKGNEGISISPDTLLALGQRRLELGLDIYEPDRDLKSEDSCPCGSGKTYGECCKPPGE
jgi:hypothetical protein